MTDEKKRQRKNISEERNRGRGISKRYRTNTIQPNIDRYSDALDRAIPRSEEDYGSLMSGYKNFADTGGFTPMDLGAIRARAIAPTRSVYAGTMRDLDRGAAKRGGYAPNIDATRLRLSRDLSSGLSDASLNAEAAIAELVQRGKLAGLSGGSSLYGTTPGTVSTYGSLLNTSTGQMGNAIGNEMNYGLGLLGAEQGATQLPGKWDSTIGRVGDVAGAVYPWVP